MGGKKDLVMQNHALKTTADHAAFTRSHGESALEKRPRDIAQVYDAATLQEMDWPHTEDGLFCKKFIEPLIYHGVQRYIKNVKTSMAVVRIDDLVLPITINEGEYDNSFVCSPYGYYISYALMYLNLIQNRVGRALCKVFMKSLAKVLPATHINRVVCVNNWPFATNIYPAMTPEQIASITQVLQQRYPNHAIEFRSLNTAMNQDCWNALKNQGYSLIASRQIFFTETQNPEIGKTRIFKSDLKLLKESEYEILDHSQLCSADIPRMLALYGEVYLEKYSDLNPQPTADFLQNCLNHQLLELRAIRKNGCIDGVVGFYCRNGVMTCPFFGYDTKKPQNLGLYRIMCTVLMKEALSRKMLFHQSSGAAFYKTIRRAQNCIDYTAVYTKHLPLFRHIPWMALRFLMNGIGIHFMDKA